MVMAEAMLDLLPLPAWIVIGSGAVVVGIAFLLKNHYQSKREKIDTTSIKDRLDRIFINPVESSGVKTDVFLINQATDNDNRKIGKIKKINASTVKINQKSLSDKEIVKDEGSKNKKYVTMTVVPGTGLGLLLKTLAYELFTGLFKNDDNRSPFAEYYELPVDHLAISDEGILIDQSISIWKKNGLWRPRSTDSQDMIQQLTFMDAHEDAMETFQELADVYSSMNTDFQVEKRLMDVKWENIKNYKQGEKRQETRDAMQS